MSAPLIGVDVGLSIDARDATTVAWTESDIWTYRTITIAAGISMLLAAYLHRRFYRISSFVFTDARGIEVVKGDLRSVFDAWGSSVYGLTLSAGLSREGMAEYKLELRSPRSSATADDKMLSGLKSGGFTDVMVV